MKARVNFREGAIYKESARCLQDRVIDVEEGWVIDEGEPFAGETAWVIRDSHAARESKTAWLPGGDLVFHTVDVAHKSFEVTLHANGKASASYRWKTTIIGKGTWYSPGFGVVLIDLVLDEKREPEKPRPQTPVLDRITRQLEAKPLPTGFPYWWRTIFVPTATFICITAEMGRTDCTTATIKPIWTKKGYIVCDPSMPAGKTRVVAKRPQDESEEP